MDDLHSLKIDRSQKRSAGEPSKWATGWIIGGVTLLLLLGAVRFTYGKLNAEKEVEITRVRAPQTAGASGGAVILNATGYIIAAHKIEVASKVVGRVAWIGVEKGDKVKQGQVLVRLEDDEYRAQLQQAKGNLGNLEARYEELRNGSRPEEVAKAQADVAQAKSDLQNANVTLQRTKKLVTEGVFTKQQLDDAQARADSATAKVSAIERTFDLVKLGPRREQVEAARSMVDQAKGSVAYAQTTLDNTIIKAPVTGTILERAVEKGEFVTTSFVGDRGAKGYVVSLADLNDLKVELDISQNDFAKLDAQQKGTITTDAYGPSRKYEGIIDEISPEANRQKATVQVKVKVLAPDGLLRPEMNANVAFYSDAKVETTSAPTRPVVYIPASAVRDNSVFVMLDGKAVKRTVRSGGVTPEGIRIEEGLIGNENLIVNPPAELKDGDKVKQKG